MPGNWEMRSSSRSRSASRKSLIGTNQLGSAPAKSSSISPVAMSVRAPGCVAVSFRIPEILDRNNAVGVSAGEDLLDVAGLHVGQIAELRNDGVVLLGRHL